jgi:hypothetical protein
MISKGPRGLIFSNARASVAVYRYLREYDALPSTFSSEGYPREFDKAIIVTVGRSPRYGTTRVI